MLAISRIFFLSVTCLFISLANAYDGYREVHIYPYHAAPYYSYPFTVNSGYIYNTPEVNPEYYNPHNNQIIMVYPDTDREYRNYFLVGDKICHLVGHALVCDNP